MKMLSELDIVHENVKHFFSEVKNQQQPKSTGKQLNMIYFPVVYTAAIKMKYICASMMKICNVQE